MRYSEIRKTLREALDEVQALATSRHADESGDVNEHLELLIRIEYVAQAAIERVGQS